MKPPRARLAASTPASQARPICSRFTMAPVPERANSMRPPQSEPAMPSALVIAGGVELEETAGRDGRPERAGGAGRMESMRLVAVLGGPADADHHLGPGHHRGQEIAAAAARLLCHGETGRKQRGAAMHAGARIDDHIVELEGMGERAVGERRHGGLHGGAAGAQNPALSARTGPLRVAHDGGAPRDRVAVDDGGGGIDDAILGALDHLGGQVLEAQIGGILRELNRFLRQGA